MSDRPGDAIPLRGARRRRPTGEPRRLLLESAQHVFTTKGYVATTTREIAERAGVSETLMFRYFGSKLGLFREALVGPFETFVHSFNDRWIAAARDRYDVEALTRQFIGELYDLFQKNRGLVVIVWAADAHTDSELSGVFDDVVKNLETLVEIGQRAATIKNLYPTPRQEIVTRATLSMIAGMAVFGTSFYGRHRPKREEIIDALVAMSLRTHVAPDATPSQHQEPSAAPGFTIDANRAGPD